MIEVINKACGLDIHKLFFIATILSRSGEKLQKRLNRDEDGILALKDWVISEKCDVVACESTSDFWVPIHDSLIKHLPVIVGNARDMKAFTHKKTDKIDSEFIAQLALNKMVQPSRIFPKDHRDFRSYVRLRFTLVQKRTDLKNEAHSILAPEMFNLKDVLTDIFGRNGRIILSGISSGKTVDQIITSLSPNVRKKSEQIRELLNREISQSAAFRLQTCLNLIKHLDDEIESLEKEIFNYAYKKHKREMELLMSIPGIGELGAATLIAEIGDFKDFSSGNKLASWLGIVPNVYQSADKFYNGRITKRGSKVARWILTQIAQAAARKKNSKLKEFFNRKKKSIGHAKAIIALARKIATIIWHLIINDEMYEDETGYKKGEIQKRKIVETEIFSVDERIKIISGIFAIMKKKDLEST
ncbi:IS110 family transposase [Methanosarcina sp. Z-7115]|uniref:IS110 family transposase n=1 Tax=Methanosarcina baikalica TaxID=3073890 RepID=A0ABU2D530_9EURY|nr:IS110 family transposase [Methanosarcina sp. Z-7115]MDR7667089.1 IS110 family transposase [Methanosarcina sp. Z-7115]